ncbi:MAG: protein kinase family protein [Gammaproteobacteria bacterium]|nr:protein kinase family protein [Gammaproteobacteria bacterium]
MKTKPKKIDQFKLVPGRIIAGKYEVIGLLGRGWEGEVYKIREVRTDITRAAKLFYPQRNVNDKTSIFYARKLHRLQPCSMMIQYSSAETLTFSRQPITALISEYIEGIPLSSYIQQQPGKRLAPFPAVHFLYALAKGMEELHQLKEYHGDLHSSNVIVQRVGLNFDLKLLDMFHWYGTAKENIEEDTVKMIRIFHEVLGGQRTYAKHPAVIKSICCGLKRSLILKKFRNASALRAYLESFSWN